MIQRIQSFLLVLALVGIVLLFMFPIATYNATDTTTGITTQSELNLIAKDYQYADGNNEMPTFIGQKGHKPSTLPLIILAAAMGTIALISIFMYKNRVNQMRVVAFGFLINIIYLFLVFLFYCDKFAANLAPEFGGATPPTTFSIGAWTPIVTAVLFFFAQRRIRADEMKVRSADRMR